MAEPQQDQQPWVSESVPNAVNVRVSFAQLLTIKAALQPCHAKSKRGIR